MSAAMGSASLGQRIQGSSWTWSHPRLWRWALWVSAAIRGSTLGTCRSAMRSLPQRFRVLRSQLRARWHSQYPPFFPRFQLSCSNLQVSPFPGQPLEVQWHDGAALGTSAEWCLLSVHLARCPKWLHACAAMGSAVPRQEQGFS